MHSLESSIFCFLHCSFLNPLPLHYRRTALQGFSSSTSYVLELDVIIFGLYFTDDVLLLYYLCSIFVSLLVDSLNVG